ncbi:MAG: hypothetical protein OXG78_09090 [Chloroflexi bacterium]|nr:hypothetical protein [Chloroflexota bacterium]
MKALFTIGAAMHRIGAVAYESTICTRASLVHFLILPNKKAQTLGDTPVWASAIFKKK